MPVANQTKSENTNLALTPLPLQRPLLMIGHGTRDEQGRQVFMDFVEAYQKLDQSRPVIPCFLELTEPNIEKVSITVWKKAIKIFRLCLFYYLPPDIINLMLLMS